LLHENLLHDEKRVLYIRGMKMTSRAEVAAPEWDGGGGPCPVTRTMTVRASR
jgi:hypothetical protein